MERGLHQKLGLITWEAYNIKKHPDVNTCALNNLTISDWFQKRSFTIHKNKLGYPLKVSTSSCWIQNWQLQTSIWTDYKHLEIKMLAVH